LIVLDTPGSLPLPIAIMIPALPVLLKLLVRDLFIVPPVSVPILVSVVSSPTRVYIIIKRGYVVIIGPTTVIVI
jgi:hypothetical protein